MRGDEMKAAALTVVVTLSLSALAHAQQEARNEREYRDHYSDLTFELNTSIPGGNAVGDVRWSKFITGSVGIEAQYSYLWRGSSWLYGGFYGGFGIDSFGGKRSSQNDPALGTFDIRTDRLNMADLEFGGIFRQNFSGFHLDEHFGIGGVFYTKQEFDILNGGPSNMELIKGSVSYMVDFGARVVAPIGKDVDLGLGISYRINGAPENGKDVP